MQSNIRPRFKAVGQHGSIADVERFHRTLKEILRRIVIPEDQADFEREVGLVTEWYNEHRRHETLGGKTPNEVHFSRPAANEQPRIEPRKNWPRGSPCAKPEVAVEGNPGDAMVLELDCLENCRRLRDRVLLYVAQELTLPRGRISRTEALVKNAEPL